MGKDDCFVAEVGIKMMGVKGNLNDNRASSGPGLPPLNNPS
jgi:hypothetical protein